MPESNAPSISSDPAADAPVGPVISFEDLRRTAMQTTPFRWGVCEQSFASDAVARALMETFPTALFGTKVRRLGERDVNGGHKLTGRQFIRRDTEEICAPETLSPLWLRFGDELLSDAYRDALTEATGVDLRGLRREVVFFRQSTGGHLDPHSDNPKKIVSHVFYLNAPTWRAEHGGGLRILRSENIDDAHHEVLPTLGRSAVIVRSDDSWHGYPPVAEGHVRLCVQVFFCTTDMQFTTEYGPDWTKPARLTRPMRSTPQN